MITAVITVIAENHMCRIRAIGNLRKASEYLAAEEAVIRCIGCYLKNDVPVSGFYTYAGVSFRAECGIDSCLVEISYPVTETLDIQLCGNGSSVYDYVPIRGED